MDKKRRNFSVSFLVVALLFTWAFNRWFYEPYLTAKTEVTYSDFLAKLDGGEIEKVTLTDGRIIFFTKETEETPREVKSTVAIADDRLVERLVASGVSFGAREETESLLDTLIGWLLPLVPLLLLWYFIFTRMSGGSTMSLGRSKAKEIEGELLGVRFDDVGGVGEAAVELKEIIAYLKEPERFQKMGARMPKGVLLAGPPGTGKTLLAKATAGEAGVPFFFLTGSSFVEMFVGVGAARVRDLFKQAQMKAPCIIFIDEIDAIGQSRMAGRIGGNSEQENTLNQLLAEMDGFEANSGVVIMAATNRPEILDPALVRPGRFDRQIQVLLPTEEGRFDILLIHAKKMRLDESVDLRRVAKVTVGFSGAELANIANEAALMAVRDGRAEVNTHDFDAAIERVVAGMRRKAPLSDEVREKVAYHEVGHALAAYYLPKMDKVHKISIIPTAKGALGYTMQLPADERYLLGEEELKNQIAVLLGGRVAERIVFGEVSSGASNDLLRATMLARRMVMEFGMSDVLGGVRYAEERSAYLAGDTIVRRDIAPQTMRLIDREVKRIIEDGEARVEELLTAHRSVMEEAAHRLQQAEVISGDELEKIAEGK
ncbi:MAG: ATP-dependent zinc metalloprotease FtsH [Selenomonadales bacterium]|nr:ATP-dependent zinc metalloprotease FtsH [Selenomonadales bacterium]